MNVRKYMQSFGRNRIVFGSGKISFGINENFSFVLNKTCLMSHSFEIESEVI